VPAPWTREDAMDTAEKLMTEIGQVSGVNQKGDNRDYPSL
jgi:hypothetical protein